MRDRTLAAALVLGIACFAGTSDAATALPTAPSPTLQCPGFPPPPPPTPPPSKPPNIGAGSSTGGAAAPGSGPTSPGATGPNGGPPGPNTGPGDTTPGPQAPGPSSGGPSGGGYRGPSAPGPSSPASPRGGSGPAPAPPAPGPAPLPKSGVGPFSGISDPTFLVDLNTWTLWWSFNRDPYLGLKRAIYRGLPMSGGDSRASLRPSDTLIREKIVPALLEALEDDPSDEATTAILLSLARIGEPDEDARGDSRLKNRIATYLSHRDDVVAESACLALGVLAHKSSLPLLVAVLRGGKDAEKMCGGDVSDRMRAFSAYGLGIAASRSDNADVRRYAIHQLLAVLGDDDARAETQVACAVALGIVTPEPVTGARHGVVVPGQEKESSPSDSIVRALLSVFEDRDTHYLVRAHVATSLGTHLRSASSDVRAAGTKSLLAALGGRRTRNETRQSCALALGKLGDGDQDRLDVKIRAGLMDAASKGDKLAGSYARVALAHIGGREGNGDGDGFAGRNEVRRFLMKRLARDKSQARAWTAIAIGVLGHALADTEMPLDDSEGAALRQLLEESSAADEASAYGIGAALLGDEAAVEALLEKLEDVGDPIARGRIAVALGLLRATEAIEPMVELLHDAVHQPGLLEKIAEALALVGHKAIVPELVEIGSECECTYSSVAVARALGRSGDGRAVEPLIELLRSDERSDLAHAWAATALGWLADHEELPWPSTLSTDLNYSASTPSLTTPLGQGVIDRN